MRLVHALVFAAGAAGLSWEVLWQLEASLAIGVSAKGTALTLATTMGAMAIGAALMGRALERRPALARRPLVVYGALEAAVGIFGAFVLLPGLALVERLDGAAYLGSPAIASALELALLACVLGPAAAAMGATIPVLGVVARRTGASLSALYALNTAGACAGVVVASFGLLPYLGVELTAVGTACVDLAVAAVAVAASRRGRAVAPGDPGTGTSEREGEGEREGKGRGATLVVVASGFVCFALEVVWFRALRAAFLATTQGFAVMLAAVLFALAVGARLARVLERRGVTLGATLAAAGVAVLLATPVLERFDRVGVASAALGAWPRTALWLATTLATIGPAIVLFGACLPWVLDRHVAPSRWGRAYGLNTLAAVVGSIAAAWIVLPLFGFARGSWLLGALASAASLPLLATARARRAAAAATLAALAVAVLAATGIGRARVMSQVEGAIARVVAYAETPDGAVAVADTKEHDRVLLVDGFVAAAGGPEGAHYMQWMGRLPMILHPAPKSALVICFGTGQTANAVRREGVESLDIVDVDAAVFAMAPLFDANERILDDPRAHAITMDGRAWLRRTRRAYDVVTLEPMPPNFAGVNALYSSEFYDLVARRLNPDGVVAQWLPIHILSVHDARAIAATFQRAFPDSLLWLDPVSATGILVGRAGAPRGFGSEWPGLARAGVARDLAPDAIRRQAVLGPRAMARYASLGAIVTDDDQLLAYGPERFLFGGDAAARRPNVAANLADLGRIEEGRP